MKFCEIILRPFSILLVSGLALIFCCDTKLAGSISETGNGGVAGAILDQDGVSAKRTQVKLIPADYDPVKDTRTISIDTTDSQGKYDFSKIASGDYVILAYQLDKKTSVLIEGVHVDSVTTNVATYTLKCSGSIKVLLPDGVNTANGYVYIPGTGIFKFLNDKHDFVMLDSVPSGAISAISYSTTGNSSVTVIRYGVQVIPQDTAIIWNPLWKYNRRLFLNTSSSGANIAGNITDLPVLIRLNSDNFDFSQAMLTGADIRFTKSDNTFLPCEIERWDPISHRAEIWVKIDTVYGNDNSHGFIMYWGNPNAIASSNSRAVFDTANGFAGVWHFAEADNNLPGEFKDATANAYNLTGATRTTAGYVDGVIGGAQKFGTVASDSIVGPCPQKLSGNSSFTVSFWIKVDTLLPSRPCILDFGKASYLAGSHFFIWPDYTAQFGIFDTGAFMKPSDPEPPDQNVFSIMNSAATWMYIVSVYDVGAGTLTSYVNGTVMDRDTISAVRIDIAGGLHIGRPYPSWDPGYFAGSVDEVRILSTPVSEERIRLSYVNESPGNTFIKYK